MESDQWMEGHTFSETPNKVSSQVDIDCMYFAEISGIKMSPTRLIEEKVKENHLLLNPVSKAFAESECRGEETPEGPDKQCLKYVPAVQYLDIRC